MQRNLETLTTVRSSGTKRLLTSWILVFRHEERHTVFTMLTVPTSHTANPQLDCPAQSQISTHFWTAWPWVKISTNCFFQKSPKFPAHRFQAWRHSHPQSHFYLGFLLSHLWMSYLLRTSVNCTQCVHLH